MAGASDAQRARADGAIATPRIGIVLHDFALGGTERIAVRLANAWHANGASVTIFSGSAEGPIASMLNTGVAVVTPDATISRGMGSRRRLGRASASFFALNPVDVVFVPGNFHWSVAPAIARLPLSSRPAIVAQVSAALDKPQRGYLRQAGFDFRMRWLLRDVQAIVALSDGARADADRIAGGSRGRTISLPALADEWAAPRAVPGDPLILAAGRLVKEKGFADLIDAFASLADQRARLTIVGDGPEREALAARATARGVGGRVILPGYVPDIRPWLDDARMFVLSSFFEGYPAVLIEALAAGRPVVATRCTPATTDLLDDPQAGLTVPVGDPGSMARAIATVLAASPPDPLALAARVQHHRIGPVALSYLDLFSRVTSGRNT